MLRVHVVVKRGAEQLCRVGCERFVALTKGPARGFSLLVCSFASRFSPPCTCCCAPSFRYDLLIDDDLKPWLVEVNASPSLSASTPADRTMKLNLIRDVYRVVVPQVLRAHSFFFNQHLKVRAVSCQ